MLCGLLMLYELSMPLCVCDRSREKSSDPLTNLSSAQVSLFISGSRTSSTTQAWTTINPPGPPPCWSFDFSWSIWNPLRREGVMSHPSARVPMTAIRGHSSWIIVKCVWTFPLLGPSGLIASSCMSLVSLVNLWSVSPCCCSIVSCFCWCLLCGFPCGLFLCFCPLSCFLDPYFWKN